VARQQTGSAMAASSPYALAFQAMARNNIAALEEKMAEVGCDVQAAPPLPVKTDSQIRACMQTCDETTNADSMSCFKTCKD